MSSLTEQERLGLDEVFLSISSGHRKYKSWSEIKDFFGGYIQQIRSAKRRYYPSKILFHSHKRLKTTNLLLKLYKKQKKKRELRK